MKAGTRVRKTMKMRKVRIRLMGSTKDKMVGKAVQGRTRMMMMMMTTTTLMMMTIMRMIYFKELLVSVHFFKILFLSML